MRILILSDTHMPRMAKQLPPVLEEHLQQADHILHAGDWQEAAVVSTLEAYAPVIGVVGNTDSAELLERFPEKTNVTIGSCRIGIIHGHGQRLTTEKRALAAFQNEDIDLLIYGHSHIPVHKKIDSITIFNPGSPTDKRKQKQYSFGVLEITQNSWELQHVCYENKKG